MIVSYKATTNEQNVLRKGQNVHLRVFFSGDGGWLFICIVLLWLVLNLLIQSYLNPYLHFWVGFS